jgi:hypothetical protein
MILMSGIADAMITALPSEPQPERLKSKRHVRGESTLSCDRYAAQ